MQPLLNVQMFDHILTKEREVFWEYGGVTCAAFPLKDLDTVSIDIQFSARHFTWTFRV